MSNIRTKHADKFRFAIVGGANTLIDFGILFGLVALGLDRIGSNYIATSIAFTFSFFANKSYTFKDTSKQNKKQFALFVVVTLFGLWVIQPIIIAGLYPVFGDSSSSLLFSKLVATLATLVWNYVMYSKVVFKKKD